MKPTILLDTAKAVEGTELRLYQHDKDFSIKAGTAELMNSRMHGSEEALADLACSSISGMAQPRILIGGLGMGFTLRAALERLPEDAEVTVAELIPEVVKWNREIIGDLAGNPLADDRVTVYEGDVFTKIKEENGYSAILLDVDNGPQRLFRKDNDKLYSLKGLYTTHAALRKRGVLGVWSSGPDADFTWRLNKVGFEVKELKVHARAGAKAGGYHWIWMAVKTERPKASAAPAEEKKSGVFRPGQRFSHKGKRAGR